MDCDKDVAMVRKQEARARAPATEAMLKREKDVRAAKSGELRAKQKELIKLMYDEANLETVKTKLYTEFNDLLGEFCDQNISVKRLFVSAEDMKSDQQYCFEPQANSFREFTDNVVTWIKDVYRRMEDAKKAIDNVLPPFSSFPGAATQTNGTSGCHPYPVHMTSEMEKAALMVQYAPLSQNGALEQKDAQLQAETEALKFNISKQKFDNQLKAEKEKAELQAAAEMKMRLLWKGSDMLCDRQLGSPSVPSYSNGYMNAWSNGQSNALPFLPVGYANIFGSGANNPLVAAKKPEEDPAAFLVQPKRFLTKPSCRIPIFAGDPLEYKAFINAFQLGVESQTDNSIERLFYMEHYTIGEPKDMIQQCLHMDPDQGYAEAKRLLKEHFGNDYQISVAHINKVLSWPTIMPGDGEALQAFALFLISCYNAMMSTDQNDKMDTPTNIWAIINKLPYRLRDEWRTFSSEFQLIKKQRPKFKDVVQYIDLKAKVTLQSAFGGFKDGGKGQAKSSAAITPSASAFPALKPAMRVPAGPLNAFAKPCLFCHGEHTMVLCKKMKRSLHKEKIEFLRGKGLCFSCLRQGHLSKFCEERLTCEVCSLRHPTVLHMKSKDRPKPMDQWSDEGKKNAVFTGFMNTVGKIFSGSEDTDILNIPPIVPVQVRAKKGSKVVTSYALLDTTSAASFCTEELMNALNLHRERKDLQLSTVGEQKTILGCIVADIEVSGVEGCDFIELREVFCVATIPVNKKNIPKQEDVDMWPHLNQVRIPHIDGPIGLLIGRNAPKAMEPVELIRSMNEGPYAIRTVLGWTVSAPLREDNPKA